MVHTVTDFRSAFLQNTRNLYVYLPPSYASAAERRYPVLYLQDGENLFHPAQLSGVAWELQHTADRLIAEGAMQEIIIVGIASTEDRKSEYTHAAGTGEYASIEPKGLLYEQFLLTEVKPYIDAHFRTLPEREHTALLGASLGAVVAFYIGFRHPDRFSKIGMMSSAFWWGERSVLRELQSGELGKKHDFQLWVDVGDAEVSAVPNYMVEDARDVAAALEKLGYRSGSDLRLYIDPGAIHSEAPWRDRAHLPLLFFFGTAAIQ